MNERERAERPSDGMAIPAIAGERALVQDPRLRFRGDSRTLGEPFALQPDALLEQRCPQLQQLVGTVLEHKEDRLPIGNAERDDSGFAVVGVFELFCGVAELASRPPSRARNKAS